MEIDVPDNDTSMSHAFDRLRWSIFEGLSKILVADDPKSPGPSLLPFIGHPIAAKAATDKPLHQLEIDIDAITKSEAYFDERPEPCTICRADGGVITVEDVVSNCLHTSWS